MTLHASDHRATFCRSMMSVVRWGVVLALVIAVLAVAWQCGSDKTPQVRERSVAEVARVKKVDRNARGSIEGTVTTERRRSRERSCASRRERTLSTRRA